MNKIFTFVLLAATLLLQGCATGRSNLLCADGCHSGGQYDQGWDDYAQKYNSVLSQGGRIAGDGKTVLVPVKGEKGVFEDPNTGYRTIHQLDCQKESTASRLFWGVVVPVASVAIKNRYMQEGAVRAGQAVQQQNGVSRYYKCSEIQEMLSAGNAFMYQQKLSRAQVAQVAAVEKQQPQQVDIQPEAVTVRHEAFCEANWKQCPAGTDWGTFMDPSKEKGNGKYTCRCR